MCVIEIDEFRCTRCQQVLRTETLAPCVAGPCRVPVRRLRSQNDIQHALCFANVAVQPVQPVQAVPANMEHLHTPGAAVAAPIVVPVVAAVALAAANVQQPAVNPDANPAAAMADGGEQSGEPEEEVNFADFIHDNSEDDADIVPNPPAYDSEMDAEGETDPEYQAAAAAAAASDSDSDSDSELSYHSELDTVAETDSDSELSYHSELDTVDETDSGDAASVSAEQAPASSSISSSGDDVDDSDDILSDSTVCPSPDVGSLYVDSDEEDAQTYAYMPNVTTRSMAVHVANGEDAVPGNPADNYDADDEESVTSSNLYDA